MMFKKRHVGRPSNEELKIRRNKKIIMILIPVVFIVAIIVAFKSGTFKNLMGNSVIEFECENGTKPFKENGKQVCEISLDAILLGDANLDGKLDNNDIILMQKAIDGAEVDEYQFAAADINGNDNIDTLDIEILTKYLNGEEVISTYKTYNLGQLLTCAKGYKLTGDKCVTTVDAKKVEEVKTVYGDINVDGKVDDSDLEYLTKYLAKYSGYDLTEQGKINADVNVDGKVNSLDRAILTKYLDKESGYEELPYKSKVDESKEINSNNNPIEVTVNDNLNGNTLVVANTIVNLKINFKINDKSKDYYYQIQQFTSHTFGNPRCEKVVETEIKYNLGVYSDTALTINVYNDKLCKDKLSNFNQVTRTYKIKQTQEISGDNESTYNSDDFIDDSNNNIVSEVDNLLDQVTIALGSNTVTPREKKVYKCDDDKILSNTNLCYKPTITNAKYEKTTKCPTGYTKLGGATCQKIISAKKRITNSYCPSGYTKVGGAICQKITRAEKTYSCPKGYDKKKSGQSDSTAYCEKETATSKKSTGNTYCPDGYTKVGGAYCQRITTAEKVYSCPSGYTKKKSGQSDSTAYCEKKVNPTKQVANTYCPSGYTKVGGAYCQRKINVSEKYSCPSGYNIVGSGSRAYCSKKVSAEKRVSNTYCPSGYSKVGGATCQKTYSAYKIPGTNQYTCRDGGTLSGKSCKKTAQLKYEYSYYCNKGQLSGKNCIINKSITVTKYCSKGTKSGNSCILKADLKTEYRDYCKEGKLQNGKCVITKSINVKNNCPKGYELKGNQCKKQISLQKEYTTYCKEGTLRNGKCVITKPIQDKFTCPKGSTPKGVECIQQKSLQYEYSYYCDKGNLNGDKCYLSASLQQINNYYCNKGETLKGNKCYKPTSFAGYATKQTKYICPKGYTLNKDGKSPVCVKS